MPRLLYPLVPRTCIPEAPLFNGFVHYIHSVLMKNVLSLTHNINLKCFSFIYTCVSRIIHIRKVCTQIPQLLRI